MARCKKNDRKAHNELYKLCFGYLMAICMRYCSNRSDAEALLNQGFLKIITGLESYRPEVPFQSWIGRVMVNTIIDDYRRDKRRRQHSSETDIESLAKHYEIDTNDAEQTFNAEELEAMVMKLPETSRKVFNLYAIDGYSHKEIAEMLGMSNGTSKWHVSFARKTLQTMLKESMKKLMNVTLV